MNTLGLNSMSKQELRNKLAADYAAHVAARGEPVRYAYRTSDKEHRRICGPKKARGTVKLKDPKQDAYKEWLSEQKIA